MNGRTRHLVFCIYEAVGGRRNKAKLKQKDGKAIKMQNLKKMQIKDKLDKRLKVKPVVRQDQ